MVEYALESIRYTPSYDLLATKHAERISNDVLTHRNQKRFIHTRLLPFRLLFALLIWETTVLNHGGLRRKHTNLLEAG